MKTEETEDRNTREKLKTEIKMSIFNVIAIVALFKKPFIQFMR
jgi:hypothetical protein